MKPSRVLSLTLVVLALTACSGGGTEPVATTTPPAADRPYLLERVDDAAVVQVYADGFSSLPLRDKLALWHLYEAAIAGRDIYYDQQNAHALDMRDVIEAIVSHPAAVKPATFAEIQRYAKLFWLNSGPYNNLTARKFVLTCTPEAFAEAAHAAEAAGATFPPASGESLDQLLARLQPMFFDPNVEPIVTNKTPGPGRDILQASANNLYVGVTMKDLAGFKEQYGLNSRLVKENGKLGEEVYRVGGRYDAQIRDIVHHLRAAAAFTTEPMARALNALAKWYETGDPADRKAYDIAWVEDKASPIDTVNGFTEVYLDSRGVKGSFEGIVFYVNQQKTAEIQKLAANAQWFEDHMPWDAKYRKAGVQGITANAIDTVVETGGAGPVTPIGINLPNDDSVREQYGSKSVSLSNVIEAYDKSSDPNFRLEFSWSPDEAARSAKWGGLASELVTNMHEVIGHASGKVAERLGGRPQDAIKEYFSALEEARADLVGLYFLADPKLADLGLVPAADQSAIVQAEYESYTRNGIVQLRRVREGTQIEEDHMRNRQMIVRWLMANTKAIESRTRDGKTYYAMTDADGFREGVGRLLAEVQRVKSEGDYAAAAKLFDTYGIHFDPKLRDEVVARVDKLKLPSYTGFVQPRLEPVKDASGNITDVAISYPQDLMKQMLEYAAMTKDTRTAFRGGQILR
jgi:dipeptidyl-peptidase III